MNFFRQFTVQKTRLPLLAVRLACLHIQWVSYLDAICKECLWIKCAPKFPLGNKGFRKRININSVPKK